MHTVSARNIHCAVPQIHGLLLDEGYEREGCRRLPMPLSVLLAKPLEMCQAHGKPANSNPFDRFFVPLAVINHYGKALATMGRAIKEDKIGVAQVIALGDSHVTFMKGDGGELCCMACTASPNPLTESSAFGMVLQFVSGLAGLEPGALWLASMNTNIKLGYMENVRELAGRAGDPKCPYESGLMRPHGLRGIQPNNWLRELQVFMASEQKHAQIYNDTFFTMVALPIFEASMAARERQFSLARSKLDQCAAVDWREECIAWVGENQSRLIVP